MEQKSKWENLSSDDDEEYVPKQKTQPKQEQQEKTEEKPEETTEQKPQYERKKLPGKPDMIDAIKKSEATQISVNIFKLEQSVTAKQIYETFHDVPIQKVFSQQDRPGSFIVYFENKENAIHFIKKAPRPINDKNFLIKVGKQQQKFDNSEWNEMGSGGRVVRPLYKSERTGNKWQDKPKKNYQNYNRKLNDDNAGFADDSTKPQETYKHHKKSYNKESTEQKEGEQKEKSEYKPRFYKGSQNKPKQSEDAPIQKAKPSQDDGFKQVKTHQDKKQEKKSEKQEKPKPVDDGWTKA